MIICIVLAGWSFWFEGEDFGVFYAAGRVTLSHGNPYDYQQLTQELLSVDRINNPYYYAPWFTWAVIPIALLPYQIARAAWAVINLILWMMGLHNLGKLVDWPERGWQRWGMYTLATILFAWTTWGSEQVGIIIFFLFTLSLLGIREKRWFTAGIWLALLLFKPNITAIPVMTICIWLLLQKDWKPVISAAFAIIGFISISLIVSPGWYLALLQPDKLTGLQFKFSESGSAILRYRTTLMDFLSAYQISGDIAVTIYGLTIAGGLILLGMIILRSRSVIHVAAVSILINFLIVPYALYYDYPPLVLALFHANDRPFRKPIFFIVRWALNILVFASLFIGTTISYRYWITIFVAALFALRGLASQNRLDEKVTRQA